MPACAPPRHRFLAWLLTGPLGHFAGGALDFAGALTRYALIRWLRPRPRS